MFEGILRISSLYVRLCEVGEINYLTWKTKFKCSKMAGCREELLTNIDENCKAMEGHLKQWKDAINGKRHECYSLNHFTMKQILNLRKELAKACNGQVAVDELPLQIFMLLESVHENIDPLILANVLSSMLSDSPVFVTEDGFKDGQKYFESDTVGESIVAESVEEVEEEIDMIQLDTRKRKSSIETFTSAKETIEGMGYAEEYLLAALHVCGRRTSEDDLVAWVISCEDDVEDVMKMCADAKKNPVVSDLLEDVFGVACEVVSDEEIIQDDTATFDR